MKKDNLFFVGKCVLAATLISGLIFYVIRNSGSKLGVIEFLVGALAVSALIGVIFYFTVSLGISVNQWTLNNGGTDTQWLWFKSDPKGLEDLRAKVQSEK